MTLADKSVLYRLGALFIFPAVLIGMGLIVPFIILFVPSAIKFDEGDK